MSSHLSHTEYRDSLAQDIRTLRQKGEPEAARALHMDVKGSRLYIRAKALALLDRKYGTVGPPPEDSYWKFLDIYSSTETYNYWSKTSAYWSERRKIETEE